MPIYFIIYNAEGCPNGKGPVLKTGVGVSCLGSNPSPSARFFLSLNKQTFLVNKDRLK